LLNCTCIDAETEDGSFADGRSKKIKSVKGYQMTTQSFVEVSARFFCDSSGDSILAPLTGADFRIGREAMAEFGEDSSHTDADTMTMGMSCLLQAHETTQNIEYIPPEWSTKLTRDNFPESPELDREYENFWYLELGGNRNTIDDTEDLRDELLSLATGAWDFVKNHGERDFSKWDLDVLGFLPGKRESRRMCGEYMVTQRDVCDGVVFEDEIAYGGWPLDDHFPGGFHHRGVPNTDIKTPAPYSLPYRALYSENVENLFFAGRNISMTHAAMSSIRVMATCGLLGEAVGNAAAIATKKGLTPHGVYVNEIKTLQEKLLNSDLFLPSKTRDISEVCKNAKLSGGDVLRNGQDRAHRLYETDKDSACYAVKAGEEITYSFDKTALSSVHVVFDSDLNRKTLPGGWCEQIHATRANIMIDSPQMHLPKTLCKSFKLIGECEGKKVEILNVTDNRKRAYHIELSGEFDKLSLVPTESWGEDNTIPVISFDFK
ncbi:MAG: FAD-dependent oxidoreductase, partial [Clostridia bacterium]|nr:FAD-dependent oxidoreductase [Clostridia bacterium]